MVRINPINLHDAAKDAEARTGSYLRPQSGNKLQLFKDYELKVQPRKDRFVVSVAVHAASLVVLLEVLAWLPGTRIQPDTYSREIPLVAPVPPAMVRKKRITLPPAKVLAKLEAPKIVAPPPPKPVELVRVTPPVIQPEKKEVAPSPEVVKAVQPKKEILVNTFASGSSAPPTLQKPARQVQTGGFGDPNGVRGTSDKGQLRAAALGSFDLPAGPGNGNGTGGSRGAKGAIASSGFGDGVAGPGSGDHGRKGQVAQAGFTQVAAAAPPPKPKPESDSDIKPVEILFKPRPVYTEEARKLHVEGEVLMQVTFSAAGHLQGMHVMRGLGHGLDEAAQRAAAQIKFRPALRDGQALDSTALVHIVFELAE